LDVETPVLVSEMAAVLQSVQVVVQLLWLLLLFKPVVLLDSVDVEFVVNVFDDHVVFSADLVDAVHVPAYLLQ
jgi:hypothetical protein